MVVLADKGKGFWCRIHDGRLLTPTTYAALPSSASVAFVAIPFGALALGKVGEGDEEEILLRGLWGDHVSLVAAEDERLLCFLDGQPLKWGIGTHATSRIVFRLPNGYTRFKAIVGPDTGALEEVANPSALFLTNRDETVTGATVFPALEGTRPVLVEIQALVVRLSSGATPRRAVVGWDNGRLAMILAVLEARCGLSFSTAEVYLNVAGGYRLSDP